MRRTRQGSPEALVSRATLLASLAVVKIFRQSTAFSITEASTCMQDFCWLTQSGNAQPFHCLHTAPTHKQLMTTSACKQLPMLDAITSCDHGPQTVYCLLNVDNLKQHASNKALVMLLLAVVVSKAMISCGQDVQTVLGLLKHCSLKLQSKKA